jgi:hypothetical protein
MFRAACHENCQDTKGATRSRKSTRDSQHNDLRQKDKKDLQNITHTLQN